MFTEVIEIVKAGMKGDTEGVRQSTEHLISYCKKTGNDPLAVRLQQALAGNDLNEADGTKPMNAELEQLKTKEKELVKAINSSSGNVSQIYSTSRKLEEVRDAIRELEN